MKERSIMKLTWRLFHARVPLLVQHKVLVLCYRRAGPGTYRLRDPVRRLCGSEAATGASSQTSRLLLSHVNLSLIAFNLLSHFVNDLFTGTISKADFTYTILVLNPNVSLTIDIVKSVCT